MPVTIQQQILRITSRKYGLNIQPDALTYLNEVLESANFGSTEELKKTIDFISQTFVKQKGKDIMDMTSVQHVVQSIVSNSVMTNNLNSDPMMVDMAAHFQILGAFHDDDRELNQGVSHNNNTNKNNSVGAGIRNQSMMIKKFVYHRGRKTFLVEEPYPSILSPVQFKTAIIRDRYHTILQRLERIYVPVSHQHHLHHPSNNSSSSSGVNAITAPSNNSNTIYNGVIGKHNHTKRSLHLIKNLNGQKPDKFRLFGMLTLMQDGKVHLEDSDDSIELVFPDKFERSVGFFSPNCFAIVYGQYTLDRKIIVETIESPPCESRASTMNIFGDKFSERNTVIDFDALLELEKSREDISFVVLSDLWMNDVKVVQKLSNLFAGFNDDPPFAFILFGNFVNSSQDGFTLNSQTYGECMDTLSDLITSHSNLAKHSHFILVPGPKDGFGLPALPYPRLHESVTRKLQTKLSHVHFASNPCRIKYCTKEYVLFRHDTLNKMRKNSLVPLNEEEMDIRKHYAKTILDQSHLCPLPLTMRPVIWSHDHAMSLYPLPDMVILADSYDTFSLNYVDTMVLNPGSFGSNDFKFLVFYPASSDSQISQVSN